MRTAQIHSAADTAASTVNDPRCIRCRAIVNVSRAEAAITSRRKEGRSRSNSAGRNSRATDQAVRLARRGDRVRARRRNLLRCTAGRRSNQGWQSRRLAREAFALIEQGKWSDANAKARDAYLLRPTEPESWRAIARLASRTNQWPPALEWWKKVDEAHRLTVEDRRDYIAAALAAGEVTLAAKQVQVADGTTAHRRPSISCGPVKSLSRQSDPVLALDYAERVLADKRAKPYDIALRCNARSLAHKPLFAALRQAWKQIEDVARDPKNPASLGALVLLANEKAVPPMTPIGGNTSLSLESASTPQPTPATQEAAASAGSDTASAEAASLPAVAAAKEASAAVSDASTNNCYTVWRYSDSRSGCHFAVNSSRTDDDPEGSGGRS